jgi:arsenate reductase
VGVVNNKTINMMIFDTLKISILSLKLGAITNARKGILQPLTDYIQTKYNNKQPVRLNFICTHNSRRSHLTQIWAQTAAHYYGIKNIYCYSGGTKATEFYPVVADTLKIIGFKIRVLASGNNPIFSIKYSDIEPPVIGFSKTYDDSFNPQSEFAAIMTCSQADEDCPFVAGTEKRISITYEDPKVFDNTPLQAEKYLERNIQIATELLYVFSLIK